MRFVVIRSHELSGSNQVQLLWTSHHLYLDGWSFSLILRDLATLYRFKASPASVSLLKPFVPLSNYLDWWVKQDASHAQQFWTKTLAGFTVPTPLPGTSPAIPASKQVQTDSVQFSPAETATLVAFARRNHITINTLLEAAWGLILANHARDVM